MSFSYEVKKELIEIQNEACCMFAQSYGFLLFGRSFSVSGLSLLSDYAEVANAYAGAAEYISGFHPEVTCSQAGKYSVSIPSGRTSRAILSEFGYDGSEYRLRLNSANIRNDCCLQAFIRGAFLACGSITDPEKDYHLEFSIASKTLADHFIKLFDAYDSLEAGQDVSIHPKMIVRGGAYIVYVKDSSSVEDLLLVMGAQNAAMELMQTKIYKDIKNNVNRKVNFETANLGRSVDASRVQVRAIQKLKDEGLLVTFPEDIRALAELRLQEQEMSLRELGDSMDPPMSRSAVNYRIKKLLDAAKNL